MHRLLITLVLCLHLMLPAIAAAQEAGKGPLNYSLKMYGVILGIALFGGLASWWGKVRKGELLIWNISALVGELTISAFAGLMAFYICDALSMSQGLMAAVVGISGHAGARAIVWIETVGQKWAEKRLGIDTTIPPKGPAA